MILQQTQVVTPEWAAAQDLSLWLTETELAACAAWSSPKRRTEWQAGRLAVKRLLLGEFDLPPLACTIGSDGVAPIVCGDLPSHISISLSHSGGLGAASWSDCRMEGIIGLDAQKVRPVHPGLLRRVFTPEERGQIKQHFGAECDVHGQLLLWAVKEAAIKARRLPWEQSLREIAVTLTSRNAGAVNMPGELPMRVQMAWSNGWWLARAVKAV